MTVESFPAVTVFVRGWGDTYSSRATSGMNCKKTQLGKTINYYSIHRETQREGSSNVSYVGDAK